MKNDLERRPDAISAVQARTLSGLFRMRVARTPDLVAYRQFEEARGEWVGYTWKQVSDLVARWERSLAVLDLAPGERVAVQLRNCLEWVCYEQAALALGLVVVPIYPNDNPGNAAYIISDSDSRVLLVGTLDQWQALKPLRDRFPALRQVLCLGSAEAETPGGDLALNAVAHWLGTGGPSRGAHSGRPGDLATIVYTSGTTGRPKGVMLSHRNILWNAEAQLETILTDQDDTFLSFLPLSHAFERTVGYYFPMMAGSCVTYARSLEGLRDDLLNIRPTVLISVPRIYEKAYSRIRERLEGEGRLAKRLFNKAVAVGWNRFLAEQGRGADPGFFDRLTWKLLKPLVAEKVLAGLGGRLRIAISGAAPLRQEVARCFVGLGLTLVEGYGLTEAAPTLAGNRVEDNVHGSAGMPIPGVEVRIADNGELLARSPGVMLGYWKRPEDTRAAIDEDGWLHTGDIAEMRNGRIYIRGRIKDILVMSSGEKIAAGDLERTITNDPLFEQALVLGEGKPFVAALVVVEQQAWTRLARSLSLNPENSQSLQTDGAKRAVTERIAELLCEFPSHARVRAVRILLEPWTVDGGLLTPTLKVKRREVEQSFERVIDELYAGRDVSR